MRKGRSKKLSEAEKVLSEMQYKEAQKTAPDDICKDRIFIIRLNLISCVLLALVTFTIYSSTFNSPFVFDDLPNIVENPYTRIFSLEVKELYDAGFKSPCPRPVANISFALNHFFGRYDVVGYHLINIIIHLISGILVYFIALAIFRQIYASYAQPQNNSKTEVIFLTAIFSALWFVVHPLQTQAVTYIVQRMTSMSAMFYLLSLYLYICGRLSRIKRRQWLLFLGCFSSWILAIGSKEIAFTLPIIVFLYEWYFFQDANKAWLRGSVKYFLVIVVLIWMLVFIFLGINPIDKILASYGNRDFTMWERVLTQFRVVILYISLILYPHPARLDLCHGIATSHSLVDPITTLVSLPIIFGLVGLALYLHKRNRLLSFGILWFFINLALESSFIGLEMIFEHRLYLPMLGPALIVFYLVFYFFSKQRLWAIIFSSVIILFLGTATYLRNNVWKDDITLMSDVVSKNPQDARAHNNLGKALSKQGRLDEALKHYSEVLRIKPDNPKARNNIGIILSRKGNINEAIRWFSEALEKNPDYGAARNNLAFALASQGRLTEAIEQFSESLRINPFSDLVQNNIGIAYIRLGRLTEGIEHLKKALQINPEYADGHNNLGLAFAKQGKLTEAIEQFSEALRINPNYDQARRNLSAVLAAKDKLSSEIRK